MAVLALSNLMSSKVWRGWKTKGKYRRAAMEANKSKLSKKAAITLVRKKFSDLNISNTTFSNINKRKPVWWFDPSNDKFNDDIHLILNDHIRKVLYYFFIKSGSIKDPEKLFRQRNDDSRTDASHIEIRVGDENFNDIIGTGFQFKKYLKDEIKY